MSKQDNDEVNLMKMDILDLGICEYKKALEIQYDLVAKVQNGEINDTLILVEHPPVVTMGRNAEEGNLLLPEALMKEKGIALEYINRGGDATYHGPGQLVGYPIFNLKKNHERSIRKFVNNLEEVFVRVLTEKYGINASRHECNAGVWLEEEKLVAIGLAVKKGVTMHGFAFNLNTILDHFSVIVPCGLPDKGVTSVERVLGEKQDMELAKEYIVQYFKEVYKYE